MVEPLRIIRINKALVYKIVKEEENMTYLKITTKFLWKIKFLPSSYGVARFSIGRLSTWWIRKSLAEMGGTSKIKWPERTKTSLRISCSILCTRSKYIYWVWIDHRHWMVQLKQFYWHLHRNWEGNRVPLMPLISTVKTQKNSSNFNNRKPKSGSRGPRGHPGHH